MALSQKTTDGQSSVTHRPRWSVIGRILLRQGAVFQFLLLPPLAAALLDGALWLSIALAAPAASAAVLLVLRRIAIPEDVRRVEAVLSVVAVFVLATLLTFPAYLALGLGPVDALFEATSALTTTGFSMIPEPESLPASAHVLRAWSQWCGGLVIAVAGLAFLMDAGPVSKALGFADFGNDRIPSSTHTHAKALLFAYLAVTVAGIAGAIVLVPGYLEGPLLALAAVSTGGMTPRGDSLASYSAMAQTFLILLCTAGAVSLAFPVLARRHGVASAARSSALGSMLKFFFLGILGCIALFLLSGVRQPEEIWPGVLNLLSLQSTTGFTVAPLPAPVPVIVLFIALMAIGGQTGSTAGGLKIDRARILWGAISLTLKRILSPPDAVLYLRLDREIIEADRILFTVALVATYLMTALVLWIAFTLHGLPAASSLFDIVSALSTVGAGTGVIGPDLPPHLKLFTIFAMLLGRIEFFGLLLLALPRAWKLGE